MKIRVVAAAIIRYGRLFLAQRMPANYEIEYGFHWECPGGKVEDGETDEKALRRELLEEHGLIPASILRVHPVPICESRFGPPSFPIELSVTHYRVDLHADDEPVARDCLGFGWFSREELLGLNLAMCPSLVQHREQLADLLPPS